MSVPFQCPSCMRSLVFTTGDSPFQNCPYCKGKIIVPSTAVHLEELEKKKPTEFALSRQRDFKLAEIRTELDAGRKIEAIKIFRETFGVGLKDAKDAVETMERGGQLEIPRSALRENFSALQINPADQKIYQNFASPKQPGAARGGAMLFWVLLLLGIIIYFIFNGK